MVLVRCPYRKVAHNKISRRCEFELPPMSILSIYLSNHFCKKISQRFSFSRFHISSHLLKNTASRFLVSESFALSFPLPPFPASSTVTHLWKYLASKYAQIPANPRYKISFLYSCDDTGHRVSIDCTYLQAWCTVSLTVLLRWTSLYSSPLQDSLQMRCRRNYK